MSISIDYAIYGKPKKPGSEGPYGPYMPGYDHQTLEHSEGFHGGLGRFMRSGNLKDSATYIYHTTYHESEAYWNTSHFFYTPVITQQNNGESDRLHLFVKYNPMVEGGLGRTGRGYYHKAAIAIRGQWQNDFIPYAVSLLYTPLDHLYLSGERLDESVIRQRVDELKGYLAKGFGKHSMPAEPYDRAGHITKTKTKFITPLKVDEHLHARSLVEESLAPFYSDWGARNSPDLDTVTPFQVASKMRDIYNGLGLSDQAWRVPFSANASRVDDMEKLDKKFRGAYPMVMFAPAIFDGKSNIQVNDDDIGKIIDGDFPHIPEVSHMEMRW